jgi:hypothetical protein
MLSGGQYRPALRRPLLILPLLAVLLALAPSGATAASPNVDALLLGATKSPVLSELRDVSDFDATRAADAEAGAPRHYDVLIVDGDRLGSGELGDVGMIQRFLDADGFVMVLDASARDHAAIARYISFDLSAGAGGERSEMVMFGNSDAAGQDEMLIVNSGDLRPAGAADAPPAEVRDLEELTARRAAIAARDQIVADRTDTPVGAAARLARANPQLPEATTSCTGDKQLCDLSAQSTSFHVDNTPQFSAPLADGYWTKERGASRDFPKPGVQEASWQSDEYFDVYLDNDGRPQGDNQVIVYRLYSTFNPARTDTFFQMYDKFKDGLSRYYYERGWWTGTIGINAEPVKGADSLAVSGFEPTTPTTETSYTTGSATNVGITASTPDGGAGFSANWTVSQSEQTEIPSWSWQARPDPAAKSLRWLFSARTPCDARPEADHAPCFDRTAGIATDVKQPSETSRKTMHFAAYGRWNACRRAAGGSCSSPVPTEGGRVDVKLSTPITLIDDYCRDTGQRFGIICSGWESKTIGADPHTYGIEPGIVNPCPDSALKDCEPIEDISFYRCTEWREVPGKRESCAKRGAALKAGDAANGHDNERIVGEITLARKVARPSGLDVIVTSDIRNAPLAVGSSDRLTELSRGKVHIDAGQSKGEFVILTNDDPPRIKCKDERTATAHIRAFLVEPADAARLRVQRPAGTCND